MTMNRTVPLDAFYEAVFVTDADFVILCCNARTAELFGVSDSSQMVGSGPEGYVEQDKLAFFGYPLIDRLTREAFVLTVCNMRRRDGTVFSAETAVHALGDGTYLFTVRDVTRRTEALHRLETANERLMAQDRERIEFVSNVSHELRTPLTSMSYAVSNMLRGLCGELPAKTVAYLERLQVDVRRLMTTVNDILDLRQIENGTLTLRRENVPVGSLLRESVAALSIQAEAKHQRLGVAPATKELYISADRHKIERVFFNLISNAVKYTQDGGTIVAEVVEEGERVAVRVRDNGIGIPPESLPKIGRRYFRVGDQVTGTGLGLAIVRELVELHGGTFSIVSPAPDSDRGTCVTVTFPRIEGPLCVIVSGDDDFIAPLRATVEGCGCGVMEDRDAMDIAAECANVTPSWFLIDGRLPESLVSDLVCEIRGTPRLARTSVVVLTDEPIPPSRQAEYGRMHVALRRWPIDAATMRVLLNG